MSDFKNCGAARSVRIEYERSNKKVVALVPILLVILGIFTRWVSGSPIPTLHYIGAMELTPPIWLMVLLFCLSYAVAGLALGIALGYRACAHPEKKYQGAMWLCISLALGYAWYPLFFAARVFLVATAVSVLCFFSSLLATLCFASVSKTSFFLLLLYDCWLLYLTFLNMQIFFGI